MTEKPKRRARPKVNPKSAHLGGLFAELDCDVVEYSFELPIALFNFKRFSRITGLKRGEPWAAVLASRNPDSTYHVHFGGQVDAKRVKMTMEYYRGPIERDEDDVVEPFSESVMKWIGSFVGEPNARATIMARFRKPSNMWRSRFNLPFKVTMGGSEVEIDGVSLILPRNPQRVLHAFLNTLGDTWATTVYALRPIEFAAFDIKDEVIGLNEALKIFLEQAT